jgi:hypothetical protein
MGLTMRTFSELFPLIFPQFLGKIVACSGVEHQGKGEAWWSKR